MACRFLIAQLPDWDWGWSLFSPGVQTQWLHYCALHYCAIHFRFYFQRQPNQSVKTNYLIYSNFGLFLTHFLLLLSATSTASAPLWLLRLDNITRLSKSADYFPNSRVARTVQDVPRGQSRTTRRARPCLPWIMAWNTPCWILLLPVLHCNALYSIILHCTEICSTAMPYNTSLHCSVAPRSAL